MRSTEPTKTQHTLHFLLKPCQSLMLAQRVRGPLLLPTKRTARSSFCLLCGSNVLLSPLEVTIAPPLPVAAPTTPSLWHRAHWLPLPHHSFAFPTLPCMISAADCAAGVGHWRCGGTERAAAVCAARGCARHSHHACCSACARQAVAQP